MSKDFSIPDAVEVASNEEFAQWVARITAQNDLPDETVQYKKEESLLNHLIQSFKMNAELLRYK